MKRDRVGLPHDGPTRRHTPGWRGAGRTRRQGRDLLPRAFDALQRATVRGTLGARGALDITVIAGSSLLALALGAVSLRRRTPDQAAMRKTSAAAASRRTMPGKGIEA
jgi:hypothetical protein